MSFRLSPAGRTLGAAALAALLSFACATSAPVAVGSVRGTAVDESGHALAAVTVTIQTESGKAIQTVLTAVDGSYVFLGVPVGTYVVLTDFQGFSAVKPLTAAVQANLETNLPVLVLRLPDQGPNGGLVVPTPRSR